MGFEILVMWLKMNNGEDREPSGESIDEAARRK